MRIKGTTEYLQVGITPELKEKINKYGLIRYTDKNGKEIKNNKNKLINDLLTEFFNNKVVSNDYITLEKPFYFNIKELLNNKCVIATTDKPTNKFNEYIKIVNVPNNLDTYNINYNSFCYNAPDTHKGILINCLLDANHQNLLIYYLGFEFIKTSYENKLILDKQDHLKISLINENDLINFLDVGQHNGILKEFKDKEKDIKKAIYNDNKINSLTNEYNLKDKDNIKPDAINNFDNELKARYKYLLFEVKETDNNLKVFPIFVMDKNNNILYGNKLIKTFENYFYLRPFYIDKLINDLIYLMQENTEIYNFIATTYKTDINKLKEFQKDYKFNIDVYNIIYNLNTSNTERININVLFDAHINNISLDKAINNFYKNKAMNNNKSHKLIL